MTPQEFADRMRAIFSEHAKDKEAAHSVADDLLCEVLREFGYAEGVEVFEEAEKWYA